MDYCKKFEDTKKAYLKALEQIETLHKQLLQIGNKELIEANKETLQLLLEKFQSNIVNYTELLAGYELESYVNDLATGTGKDIYYISRYLGCCEGVLSSYGQYSCEIEWQGSIIQVPLLLYGLIKLYYEGVVSKNEVLRGFDYPELIQANFIFMETSEGIIVDVKVRGYGWEVEERNKEMATEGKEWTRKVREINKEVGSDSNNDDDYVPF